MSSDQPAGGDTSDIWSGSDFPYVCLKDRGRTTALIEAVSELVNPGDVVLDVGSGSGILALVAARSGAASVTAVEVDSLMARTLRETVSINGYDDVISVINADARDYAGQRPDVVLAELIDTALVDEPLVPVMNDLAAKGVVDDTTRLLFAGYSTRLALVNADDEYYGFRIAAPKHEWPYYADESAGSGWWSTTWDAPAQTSGAGSWAFGADPVDPAVAVVLDVPASAPVNCLLMEGTMHLGTGVDLGAFNSLNAPKLLPLNRSVLETGRVLVRYEMGSGLHTVVCEAVDPDFVPGDHAGAVVDLRDTAPDRVGTSSEATAP